MDTVITWCTLARLPIGFDRKYDIKLRDIRGSKGDYATHPPYSLSDHSTISIMVSSHLPYPAQARAGPTRTWPVVLLAIVLFLATATRFQAPIASWVTSSDPSNIVSTISSWTVEREGVSTDWLDKQVKCPVQPKPLHPKLVWNLTDEERAASLVKFQQAVVSISVVGHLEGGKKNHSGESGCTLCTD